MLLCIIDNCLSNHITSAAASVCDVEGGLREMLPRMMMMRTDVQCSIVLA